MMDLNRDYLKKALAIGLPAGIAAALLLITLRAAVSGSGFMNVLASDYGVLVTIAFPLMWVVHFYRSEKRKAEEEDE